MKQASIHDISRARRLVAALAEDNQDLAVRLLGEAKVARQLIGLASALAVGHLTIAREFYDSDCEHILARQALEAMDAAQAEPGDTPRDK